MNSNAIQPSVNVSVNDRYWVPLNDFFTHRRRTTQIVMAPSIMLPNQVSLVYQILVFDRDIAGTYLLAITQSM